MTRKLIIFTLFIIHYSLGTLAHIGSPGVTFQGQAGAYRVLVSLQPPDVIPGTAQVTVYVESGQVKTVSVRPIYFRSGDGSAPSADVIEPVAGQPNQFQGIAWLMDYGSSSVQIQLDGASGKAELIVPLLAVSTAERDLPAGLGWGLAVMALLLVFLLITAISSSVSDGILKAGEQLTTTQKRKRLLTIVIATAAVTGLLYGGRMWWNSASEDYRRDMYKPLQAQSKIVNQNGQRLVSFLIDTNSIIRNGRRRDMLNLLIADHGKLMHLFLVRMNSLDAFAHLHPVRRDSTTFEAYLPQLPAGKYLVYADIVQRSGFAETIADTLDVPEMTTTKEVKKTDEEDTYVVTDPLNNPTQVPIDANVVICGRPGTRTKLKDGSTVVWECKTNQSFEVGKLTQLSFEVFAPNGEPANVETYLGMAGHAAIVRQDGSVYIHLHPVGTFAMAAEKVFQNRLVDTTKIIKISTKSQSFRDSIDRYVRSVKAMTAAEREVFLMKEMGMKMPKNAHGDMAHSNRITFPYTFPKTGQYRIFVQIKRNGQVLTAVFDAKVS
jgi:hypothetical protein